ncbi:MAG: EF-hand domain-containing protein [Rubripirellula sp.]
MNTRSIAFVALSVLVTIPAMAQSPFGGGDRGGGRGDRGGDAGGGRGGAPGGDRGGNGGGGFPGGGRGGATGGDRASRGGFDPSAILERLDANGNGVLDPDEQQGPASFLIGRLQQSDPSIKPGSPIKISKLKEGFEKMRGGGDPNSRGGGDTSNRNAADEALMVELLVPGFGEESLAAPLLGFGPKAEMLSVPVTDADRAEAAQNMRRYDRNGNGFIEQNELSSRMSGNPMDFDRNRDGKLTLDELAVRYARRREGEEEAKKNNKKDKQRNRDDGQTGEVVDVFSGRKSYRPTSGRKAPEGLPGYFTDKDANGDGQISMAEFATEWNDDVVAQFFDSDFNRDGVITTDEALRAVEQGPVSKVLATMSAGAAGSSSSGSTTVTTAGGGAAATASGGKADPKYVKVVKRIVQRYDNNNDGMLTASEWEKMLMSPAAADANRDGRISVEEYALWMQSNQKKR